mgnify:CR=1 FL=1
MVCYGYCDTQRHLGGFTVPSGGDEEYTPAIILYENNITDKDELEKTLQHELVNKINVAATCKSNQWFI